MTERRKLFKRFSRTFFNRWTAFIEKELLHFSGETVCEEEDLTVVLEDSDKFHQLIVFSRVRVTPLFKMTFAVIYF